MRANQQAFGESIIVRLKDQSWLENQRFAGKVAGKALCILEAEVKNKTRRSLLELDKIAHDYIVGQGCLPTFLGYKGFPNCACISTNKQLVHGIPTNYHLQDGDTVSFDLGATYKGCIADTAITCVYGERSEKQKRLIDATKIALQKGIDAIVVGKRLGVIGQAIYKYATEQGFGVIVPYGGHGICTTAGGIGIPHASPFVSNRSTENEGIRLTSGMVLAIEPMLTVGSTKTSTSSDGWTVMCEAESSAHEEHTIFIREDGVVEIITNREGL